MQTIWHWMFANHFLSCNTILKWWCFCIRLPIWECTKMIMRCKTIVLLSDTHFLSYIEQDNSEILISRKEQHNRIRSGTSDTTANVTNVSPTSNIRHSLCVQWKRSICSCCQALWKRATESSKRKFSFILMLRRLFFLLLALQMFCYFAQTKTNDSFWFLYFFIKEFCPQQYPTTSFQFIKSPLFSNREVTKKNCCAFSIRLKRWMFWMSVFLLDLFFCSFFSSLFFLYLDLNVCRLN